MDSLRASHESHFSTERPNLRGRSPGRIVERIVGDRPTGDQFGFHAESVHNQNGMPADIAGDEDRRQMEVDTTVQNNMASAGVNADEIPHGLHRFY
jgi:hypothetical protein